MRKYFTYKTLDDLREDIKQLGVHIPLEEHFEKCFEPIQVGGRRVGNRFVIQPMEGCDGTLDGKPDVLTFRRWERFGAGGAKIIWGEATAILDEARANTRQLLMIEENLSALEELIRRTRAQHRAVFGSDDDLLIGIQLTHSGRYSVQRPLIAQHDPVVDGVTWVDKKRGIRVTPDYPTLSDDELKRVEDAMVQAARLAAKVGFDFVDVKQCHRYLLSELLAARLRPGPYGGSYENRTRLARNAIRRIVEELGDQIIVATRLNAYDGIPYYQPEDEPIGRPVSVPRPYLAAWGTDPENPLEMDLSEPIQYVREMAEWGVRLINVSMGSPYYNPHIGRPFERPPIDGYQTPEHPLLGVDRHFRATEAIQRAVPEIPVVGTGYSWLQHYLPHAAEGNLRVGRVSLIGVGRGSLAYPDFVKDMMEGGEFDRRKVCVTVSYCTALMRAKHNELGQFPTGCVPRDRIYAEIYKEALRTAPKE
ncbi:MAG: NADH:flavin oxidoreductase [Candidatus Poribacteria bacterium]|nr:MAG: NADH:flavin oxidoreductase [Candidatus Poribacteria bacterium]